MHYEVKVGSFECGGFGDLSERGGMDESADVSSHSSRFVFHIAEKLTLLGKYISIALIPTF